MSYFTSRYFRPILVVIVLVATFIGGPILFSNVAMAADPYVELLYDNPTGRADRVMFYPNGEQASLVNLVQDSNDPDLFVGKGMRAWASCPTSQSGSPSVMRPSQQQ